MSAPPTNRPTGPRTTEAEREAKLETIVKQALQLRAGDGMEFVKLQCAGDDLMLAQAVERLRSTAPQWWEMSIESRAFDRADGFHERTGELIGPYRVIRILGSGGMGEVLLAQRDDRQFHQQVAIKLVRRGTLSPSVQARLKAERQILATLDHPNIARLLDGGTDRNGTPYIVMEYIEGEPIDVYCDRHKLPLNARIGLFRTVCSAVHCAHQNLVVHRDLKPSNILVTADGTPKLLDFGIAKIIDDRHMLHTMAVTQLDVRVMTPEHASPEQVRGDVITTASDVYCLGVLLYQLLAGSRPYAIKSYRLSEVERAICDEEPLPLHALFTKRDNQVAIEEVCANRSTGAGKLARELRGDLADIVMTALRKEPERRYASAEQLSADLDRYLRALPVTASKDHWRYRTRKFVRRHRWGVAIAAAALMGIVTFAVVATIQAGMIAREQARAEYVSSFLIDMFQQADPSHSRGNDITAREILDAGVRNIDNLKQQPETRARLQATLGKVYTDLGLFDGAEKLLRDSLAERLRLFGPYHAETADANYRLGDALLARNQYTEATPLLEAAVAYYRNSDLDKSGNDVRLAASLRRLAVAQRNQQRMELAAQQLDESLQLLESHLAKHATAAPDAHHELSNVLNHLAQLAEINGDYTGAIELYRRAATRTEIALGHDHPLTAINTHNLGMALQKRGRLAEAQPLLRESLAMYRKVFGPEHVETLSALANYGMFLHRSGALDDAEQTFREVIELDRRVRGATHSYVGYDSVNLGLLLFDKGRYREAEAEHRKALDVYAQSLPANHAFVGSARRSLGLALLAQGRYGEAERQLRSALEIFSASLEAQSPQVLYTQAALGQALAAQKRTQIAEPLLRESYAPLRDAYGESHPNVLRVRGWIEALYRDMGTPDVAQTVLQQP